MQARAAPSGAERARSRFGVRRTSLGEMEINFSSVQTRRREVASHYRTVMRACHHQNSQMPTDIMANCRAEHFGGSHKKTCDAEVKSGFLVLLGPGGIRQDVRVIVYRTSLEHFAVIYPRKRLSKPIGVVNLRNTSVERVPSNSGFFVRQKGYDNAISAKFLCSERDIDAWLSAFAPSSSPNCHHHASLPVLVEAEES